MIDMQVEIYMGGYDIVKKSGVGRAILHQEEMLRSAGVSVTEETSPKARIVHINTTLPDAPLAAVWAKLHGKSVVYYGHSTMEDFRNSFIGSNLFAPLFKAWIKFCYNLGDVVITPTNYSADILRGYNLRRPVVALSNGIDTDFFAPSRESRKAFRLRYDIEQDAPVVISVGHYIERKGIIEFVDLARSMPDVRFMWFGSTSLGIVPQNVRDAVENAPENLMFPGYVDASKLREAYCGADVFAFMSHEETEGIVVLEALACAVPTVVRDIPVYDGWLTDGENVHKAATTDEFREKIRGLLSGKLPRLLKEERAVAKSRSVAAMGKKLKAVYREQGFDMGEHKVIPFPMHIGTANLKIR